MMQRPERNWERIDASHPDHLAAGERRDRAVYPDARNPFAHLELRRGGPRGVDRAETWLMAHPDATAGWT